MTEQPAESGYIWIKISDEEWIPARYSKDDNYPVEIVGSDEIYKWDTIVEEWRPLLPPAP